MRRTMCMVLLATLAGVLFVMGCVKDPVVEVTPFVVKSSDAQPGAPDELK